MRHLSDQQTTTLKTATAALPDGLIRVGHVDDVEAKQLSEEIKKALGSKVDESGLFGGAAEFTQMGKFAGVNIGANFNDTNHLYYDYARNLATAMSLGGFPDAFFAPVRVQVPIVGWNAKVVITVGAAPLP